MKSIIIYDWMLRNSKLTGVSLLIYAAVYHFTALGSVCFMSVKSWLNLLHCSKSQFYKARNDLIAGGHIMFDEKTNGIVVCGIDNAALITSSIVDTAEFDNALDAYRSWDEMIKVLTKSDNETAKSDNETAKSDNETLPY